MIVYADDSGPISWPTEDSHDPSSKKYYYLFYRPEIYSTSKEYIKGVDIVIPTIPNGCMYECVSGGISGLTEPSWITQEGRTLEDNDVKWKCVSANLRLKAGDTITASTWSCDDATVTLESPIIISDRITGIKVSSVPSTLKKIRVTNHITVTRSSSRTEEFEKTIVIPIKEQ